MENLASPSWVPLRQCWVHVPGVPGIERASSARRLKVTDFQNHSNFRPGSMRYFEAARRKAIIRVWAQLSADADRVWKVGGGGGTLLDPSRACLVTRAECQYAKP